MPGYETKFRAKIVWDDDYDQWLVQSYPIDDGDYGVSWKIGRFNGLDMDYHLIPGKTHKFLWYKFNN